ncbi:D-alanine--D-alanine ligase [uncultured Helicobacter sp.]|uniref:D-alanine--D-alanine ligase n=1 Tax=uncultured Helicobacter sp. TaxID=175537 RepID=UPI0025952E0E|nr:D-alanine--D-alanine ligase [uncultured Helicobacter sp.]
MSVSVLFGGLSFEHEISIVSAVSLKKILKDKVKYFIFLDSTHQFYLIPTQEMKSSTFATGAYKKHKKLHLKVGYFYSEGFLGKEVVLSDAGVIINLIHGADGEDGSISALLDFYKIAYIGPRIEACAISFNKILTKIYAKQNGIKCLEYERFTSKDDVEPSLPYPFIIKPARLGSSIGVSVVSQQSEMEYALDSAFGYDDEILIEPFYKGVLEYNLAGYKMSNGEFRFSLIEEPQKKDLLGFEDKYLDFSHTEQVVRANISPELESKIQEAFKKIYGDVFCGALIRCDFFVIDDCVYLNEINPIPGSFAHYLFEDFMQVIQDLQQSLPRKRPIKVDYKYVLQIQHAKGK